MTVIAFVELGLHFPAPRSFWVALGGPVSVETRALLVLMAFGKTQRCRRGPAQRWAELGRPGRFCNPRRLAWLKAALCLALAGFVPYLSCQGTSGEDHMDHCLEDFQEQRQRYIDRQEALHRSVDAAPKLKPVCSEDTVLRALHEYTRKYHPLSLGMGPPNQLPLRLAPSTHPRGHREHSTQHSPKSPGLQQTGSVSSHEGEHPSWERDTVLVRPEGAGLSTKRPWASHNTLLVVSLSWEQWSPTAGLYEVTTVIPI
ncbi:hypothetical protein GHT09_008196 [Marmota monax]|uniref:Uncharacterized protein n=1 Tax=Marmota monax TaxID=9995 RepID=A0A834UKS4_MARMO|nr:hypothetical protein GHT09_008196 [Marmota monax]